MNTAIHTLDDRTFRRIATAIDYVARQCRDQPSVADMARAAAMSEFHFSRTFQRWAGVSPKRYLQQLTLGAAKTGLGGERSILEAALEAGLSGPGRLHDLCVELEAVTPGEMKSGGVGLECRVGVAATPFGTALFGWTARGIGHLEFVAQADVPAAVESLRARWPAATWCDDDAGAAQLAAAIWPANAGPSQLPLRLYVRGTNFQVQVWRALLRLADCGTTTYGDLAQAVGRPGAARAVGRAVGANPVAWLIPCHRVLRARGELGGYRWGLERKQAMLAWEHVSRASQLEAANR